MTCPACIQARANAAAAGHRKPKGVCFDCAAVELPDSFFADVTEEHRRQACREMGFPYIPPAVSGQPDLFSERTAA